MDFVLAQLVDRIHAAVAQSAPLRIRGGGSKDFYGQTLQGDLLDTRTLQGIVSYEPSELVVTVRAGTPLAELEAALAEQGQYLPFEPPHFAPGAGGPATVGGMVAAGLGGPARAAVGNVRDYVLGVQIINGKGELLTFGGQVMKNVAGYDVSRLMAGSLGTLGVITEVSLKVLPVAVAEATLLFHLDQASAIKQLNTWGGKPLPINASCWVNHHAHDSATPASTPANNPARNPCLTVRLRGARAAVDAACRSMGGERQDTAAAVRDWHALREQTGPFFTRQRDQCLWRLSLPDTASPLNLGETLIEWGGAQRWVKAPASEATRLREAVSAVGGSATLFIAAHACPTRAEAVFHPLKAPLDRIHRDLKRQFDPAGIFNPERLYAD
ncbi:MAG: glycolate oxidase subunit GlcE [Pseudomonadota bacterium]